MDMTDAQRLNTPAPRTDADWLAAHWMPFTGNRDFKANPRLMTSAQGCTNRRSAGLPRTSTSIARAARMS